MQDGLSLLFSPVLGYNGVAMDETEQKRKRPWRRLRLLILAAAGLVLLALALLVITAPDPTIVRVRVADAASGEPLHGAAVQLQSRGAQPLPAVATDEDGLARFRNIPAASTYVMRVQHLDYELVIRPQIAVPEGKTTRLDISLSPSAGRRLYVGLDNTRLAEIDTASLLPVASERLPNWKQGYVSEVLVHPSEGMLYTVTSAEQPGNAESSYDEIDVLHLGTKAIEGRVEVDGRVHDVELTADGHRLLALTTPGGRPELLSQAKVLSIDAMTGHLLTSTLLADLDLAGSGAYIPPLPPDVNPELRAAISNTLFPPAEAQMVLTPDGASLYVLHSNDPQVWRLDTGARQVLDRLPIPAWPRGGALSGDGRSLFVWGTGDPFAVLYPFPTTTVMVPGDRCPTDYTPATGRVAYLLLAPSVLIGADGMPISPTLSTGSPSPEQPGIARYCIYYDPAAPASKQSAVIRGSAAAGNEQSNVLVTIDTDQNAAGARQELAPGTTQMVVSPARPEVYVLNGTLGTLSILPLDGSAPTVIAVGSEPVAVAVSGDGRWAYVANRESRSISAIYLPGEAVIETIPVDGVPYSLALHE